MEWNHLLPLVTGYHIINIDEHIDAFIFLWISFEKHIVTIYIKIKNKKNWRSWKNQRKLNLIKMTTTNVFN